MAYFTLNRSAYDKLRKQQRSDRAIARLLGVDPATLSRVLQGKTEPTGRIIAGAVAALGAAWVELFQVVNDD